MTEDLLVTVSSHSDRFPSPKPPDVPDLTVIFLHLAPEESFQFRADAVHDFVLSHNFIPNPGVSLPLLLAEFPPGRFQVTVVLR